MSDEENPNEMLDSSSEVSGQPMKKKKKKKKLPNSGEADTDLTNDAEGSSRQNSSRKSKKKKKPKSQSSRSETSSAFDGESDISSRKKKQMSQINENTDEDFDQRENDYARHHFDEEQTFGSTMDSSRIPSEARNERGRYNGQQQSMHSGSYDDNGYVDYANDDLMSAMGNTDPVDGYNQDFIGEEDEEEPRFKYSTADLEEGGWRNQTCTLIAAGVFFVIIAIAVSIFLAKLRNTAQDDLEVRGSN